MTTSIVFMGTPQFAVPILQSLIDHPEYDVQAVLTQPDHRVGRKHVLTASPVKRLAVENDNERQFLENIVFSVHACVFWVEIAIF